MSSAAFWKVSMALWLKTTVPWPLASKYTPTSNSTALWCKCFTPVAVQATGIPWGGREWGGQYQLHSTFWWGAMSADGNFIEYSKSHGFRSEATFLAMLLLAGRCYEAEICAVLLPLRCPFRWHPFAEIKLFSFWPKTIWTIVGGF